MIVRLLLQLLLHSHGDTDLIGDVGRCNNMYPRGLEESKGFVDISDISN